MRVGRIVGGHERPVRIRIDAMRCDERPVFELVFDCGHTAAVEGRMAEIPRGYVAAPSPAWTGVHPSCWDGWIATLPGAVAYCPVCAEAAVRAALPPDYREGDWWVERRVRYEVLTPLELPGVYLGHVERETGLPLFVVERRVPASWNPTIEVGDGWALLNPHGREVWRGYGLRPWDYATDEDARPYLFLPTTIHDEEVNG